MAQRIGILGGTFNPVHYGHLAAAEEVRDRLKLERVLFVPSFLPPHKHEEDIPSAIQRQEMVRLAIVSNPLFKLSDIEVKRGGRSYTIETIEGLAPMYPGAELYFIMGLDSFLEIRTWKEWERLLTLCTFVVLSRDAYRFRDLKELGLPGPTGEELSLIDSGAKDHVTLRSEGITLALLRIPLYEISSTDIRQRVRSGRSIKYLLPEQVEHYIIDNKLYG